MMTTRTETAGNPKAASITPPVSFTASTTPMEKTKRVAHAALKLFILGMVTLATHAYWPAKMAAITATATAAHPLILPALAILGTMATAYTIYKIIQVVIGSIVNPATLMGNPIGELELRKGHPEDSGSTVQIVTIYKGGVAYKGAVVTHPNTKDSGNWTLHLVGNGETLQTRLADRANFDFANGSNTLIINGPNVAGSGGWSTPAQMSDSADAGIQYLEDAVKADKITIVGHSLGGGILGEGILKHKFRESDRYLVVAHMTFNSLPDIAGNLVPLPGIPTVLRFFGHTMDTMKGLKKLDDLNIKHIAVKGSSRYTPDSDEVIPHDVSPVRFVMEHNHCNVVVSPLNHNQGLEPHHRSTPNLVKKIQEHFGTVPAPQEQVAQ